MNTAQRIQFTYQHSSDGRCAADYFVDGLTRLGMPGTRYEITDFVMDYFALEAANGELYVSRSPIYKPQELDMTEQELVPFAEKQAEDNLPLETFVFRLRQEYPQVPNHECRRLILETLPVSQSGKHVFL